MKTPKIIDKWLHVAQDGYDAVIRYSSRTMTPKAIFIHIQEGSNWGSWQWFHRVTASATVLAGKAGDIWRLVPEEWAPWTNGDVNNPTPRGRSLIARFGPNPNLYSLTIECEGFTGQSVPEAQMDAIVWQVKQWQARYGLTNDDIYRHADVNQVDKSRCPGDGLFNELMKRLAATPQPAPEPVKPKAFTLRFDTYLRTSPGFWDTERNRNNVITLVKAGTTGEVLEGPTRVDGVDFYNLRIPGQGIEGTGWMQMSVIATLDIKEAA